MEQTIQALTIAGHDSDGSAGMHAALDCLLCGSGLWSRDLNRGGSWEFAWYLCESSHAGRIYCQAI